MFHPNMLCAQLRQEATSDLVKLDLVVTESIRSDDPFFFLSVVIQYQSETNKDCRLFIVRPVMSSNSHIDSKL